MSDASAVSVPSMEAPPLSPTVIQSGHVVPSAKVTSSLSSSAAVMVTDNALSSARERARSASPSPSSEM